MESPFKIIHNKLTENDFTIIALKIIYLYYNLGDITTDS